MSLETKDGKYHCVGIKIIDTTIGEYIIAAENKEIVARVAKIISNCNVKHSPLKIILITKDRKQ